MYGVLGKDGIAIMVDLEIDPPKVVCNLIGWYMVVTGSKHASTIHIDSVPVYRFRACHAWIGQQQLNQMHVSGPLTYASCADRAICSEGTEPLTGVT